MIKISKDLLSKLVFWIIFYCCERSKQEALIHISTSVWLIFKRKVLFSWSFKCTWNYISNSRTSQGVQRLAWALKSYLETKCSCQLDWLCPMSSTEILVLTLGRWQAAISLSLKAEIVSHRVNTMLYGQ